MALPHSPPWVRSFKNMSTVRENDYDWQAMYQGLSVDLENCEVSLRAERRKCAALKKELEKQRRDDPKMKEADRVFDHWCQVIHPNARRRPVFGERRVKVVLARLREGHTVSELCRAIDGCAVGAFTSENGIRHDDLELICRDETKVSANLKRADMGGIIEEGAHPVAFKLASLGYHRRREGDGWRFSCPACQTLGGRSDGLVVLPGEVGCDVCGASLSQVVYAAAQVGADVAALRQVAA